MKSYSDNLISDIWLYLFQKWSILKVQHLKSCLGCLHVNFLVLRLFFLYFWILILIDQCHPLEPEFVPKVCRCESTVTAILRNFSPCKNVLQFYYFLLLYCRWSCPCSGTSCHLYVRRFGIWKVFEAPSFMVDYHLISLVWCGQRADFKLI